MDMVQSRHVNPCVSYNKYHNNRSQPHSPYTAHPFSNKQKKINKRKSVFAQINDPSHSAQVKVEQHKNLKPRASLTARKKREEQMVRKTVTMNAHQHQQLLTLVKNNNQNDQASPSSPDKPNDNNNIENS